MPAREDGLLHIKEAIKNNPKGMTISDIAELLGMSRNTVSKYLDMLHISGQVEMRTYGPAKVYSISHRVPINAMLDLASDLIIVLDERLEVIQANDNTVRFIGMRKETLLGSILEKSTTPLFSDPKILEHAREALLGISSSFEIELSLENRDYYFKAKAIPTIMGDGKSGVTLILEDITEQRIAQEDLLYSEEKYRALFENSEYAIVINDDEGHFDCNKAMKRLFATDDLEQIKAHLYETHPPLQPDGRDSLQFMKENVEKVRLGKTVRFEWTMRDFKGNDKLTEITISPITIRGMKMRQSIVRDLSKHIEEQTRLMFLSSAVEAAAESIVLLDMQGRVTDLNDSAMRMLGIREKSEVIGEYWSEKLADPEEVARLEQRFMEFLRTGTARGLTTRVRRRDGTSFPLEVSSAVIRDAVGEPKGIVTVSRDISEKQFFSESLKKRERILNAISSAFSDLYEEEDPGVGLSKMTRLLGEAVGASRSYISVLMGDLVEPRNASLLFGWTNDGILPRTDDPSFKKISIEGFDRWVQCLANDEIIEGTVANFPTSEQIVLSSLGIRSILVIPIFHHKRWIGIIGFDDCVMDKEWDHQKIGMLRLAAKIISPVLWKALAVPSHPLVAGDPVERGDRAP